jgi:hypothetical protein
MRRGTPNNVKAKEILSFDHQIFPFDSLKFPHILLVTYNTKLLVCRTSAYHQKKEHHLTLRNRVQFEFRHSQGIG